MTGVATATATASESTPRCALRPTPRAAAAGPIASRAAAHTARAPLARRRCHLVKYKCSHDAIDRHKGHLGVSGSREDHHECHSTCHGLSAQCQLCLDELHDVRERERDMLAEDTDKCNNQLLACYTGCEKNDKGCRISCAPALAPARPVARVLRAWSRAHADRLPAAARASWSHRRLVQIAPAPQLAHPWTHVSVCPLPDLGAPLLARTPQVRQELRWLPRPRAGARPHAPRHPRHGPGPPQLHAALRLDRSDRHVDITRRSRPTPHTPAIALRSLADRRRRRGRWTIILYGGRATPCRRVSSGRRRTFILAD